MMKSLFYSGVMHILADFAGKMGMCLDDVGDNHGTDHSKDYMCCKNSPMEHMQVLQGRQTCGQSGCLSGSKYCS
jgi:hypothetical protein